MELSLQSSKSGRQLSATIQPHEYTLTAIAVETGIELERHQTTNPYYSAEAILTLARWSGDNPPDHDDLTLNHYEASKAMIGLSYLKRTMAERALDSVHRCILPDNATPDIGTPSPQLATAARQQYRQASRSLIASLDHPTV